MNLQNREKKEENGKKMTVMRKFEVPLPPVHLLSSVFTSRAGHNIPSLRKPFFLLLFFAEGSPLGLPSSTMLASPSPAPSQLKEQGFSSEDLGFGSQPRPRPSARRRRGSHRLGSRRPCCFWAFCNDPPSFSPSSDLCVHQINSGPLHPRAGAVPRRQDRGEGASDVHLCCEVWIQRAAPRKL